jgi:ABC-type cobalamin/Fe3+-siderophores transport system ATPase subunit
MTPGKQALFALTLILAESGEPWPLLIDQPEDDLDSRSVCEVIVKDLMRRKRERQIILVSHDANLVIGADSEEVIVANRHGDDRPNRGAKKFAYLTGSLEHSVPRDPRVKTVLDTAGIREHACDILDGGAEAFQKRKDKYRI